MSIVKRSKIAANDRAVPRKRRRDMNNIRPTRSLLNAALLRKVAVVFPVLLFHRVVHMPATFVEVIEKMAFFE
jgi:hypothetical protein